VECTFGILKKRFAILKFPMQYSTRDKLDNFFHVCCIFHSMLLEYDGLQESFHGVVNCSYYENDKDDLFIGLRAARVADHLRLMRNRGSNRSFCAPSNITTGRVRVDDLADVYTSGPCPGRRKIVKNRRRVYQTRRKIAIRRLHQNRRRRLVHANQT
jgi:hypothetical protein